MPTHSPASRDTGATLTSCSPLNPCSTHPVPLSRIKSAGKTRGIHCPFQRRFRAVRAADTPTPLSSVMGGLNIAAPLLTFSVHAQDSTPQLMVLLCAWESPLLWGLQLTYAVPGRGQGGANETVPVNRSAKVMTKTQVFEMAPKSR